MALVDSIKTPKKPKPKKPRTSEWRATLTIHRANTLTDEERFNLCNWLRATANSIGGDEYGRNLAPTYHARWGYE